MGGAGKRGTPLGRQRDAYEALTMLNTMVGTQGIFDVALNLATELSRVFFLGGGVANSGQDSYGLSCRALGGLETETSYPPAVVDEGPKVKEPAEAGQLLSKSALSLFQISSVARKTTPSVPTTDLYQIPLALTHPR
ncbi:hypothetical protein MRX96_010502 [Rhipicephalus microplus]